MRKLLRGHIPVALALAAAVLPIAGCMVRKERRISPSQLAPPPREATLEELVARINSQSEAFRTMTATVDLEPTAGSVYSGVIKEYHDVKGFVLLERPALIRMQGQAPVVRTTIFDMVSNGEEFKLYIPPKQKFIVGKTAFRRPAKSSLENLRPQHILEALLVPPVTSHGEKCFLEPAEDNARRYYIVTIVEPAEGDKLRLKRKAWFDSASLELVREQFYSPESRYVEDVHYSGYQDFQGLRYPSRIELNRPVEDYSLAITIQKATFNQPIAPGKFELQKPEGAQLVDLSAAPEQEKPRGQ